MTMKKFGDRIEFNEVFHDVVYIKEKELEKIKLYDTDESDFTIVPHEERKDLLSRETYLVFRRALRKVLFRREHGEGIIIGQTKRMEGYYEPGYQPTGFFDDPTDYEAPYLGITHVYPMWIVATAMNKTVMVPKNGF